MKVTNHKSKTDWLASRQKTVGASEVAAILGACPYRQAYDVWAEKKGLVEPFAGNIATRVGLALEDLVAELYTEETGFAVSDPGDYAVYYHATIDRLTCTPDRFILDEDGKPEAVIELKTMGYWAARYLDDLPLNYQIQLQTQMAVTGVERGAIAWLIGNHSFQVIEFDRHPDLIEQIEDRVAHFLYLLDSDTPPPFDHEHDTTAKALQDLHPDDNGETLCATPEHQQWLSEYSQICDSLKTCETAKQKLRNQLAEAMADNTFLDAPGWSVSYKTAERKDGTKYRTLRIAER